LAPTVHHLRHVTVATTVYLYPLVIGSITCISDADAPVTLDAEARDLGDDGIDLVSMVAGIGPDQLEPRNAVPYPLDHPRCAIAVLNAR